ncbi:MAG TPA: hypothetical protein VN920_13585 [Pyrinomonadaceae bacterium]|nr:hypothetical protein [Pyrinomonadaceae bacterium]
MLTLKEFAKIDSTLIQDVIVNCPTPSAFTVTHDPYPRVSGLELVNVFGVKNL